MGCERTMVRLASGLALAVFLATGSGRAEMVATSCLEAEAVRARLEDKLRELAPPFQAYVRTISCHERVCTVELDFIAHEPGCAEVHRGGYECRVSQDACPDLPGQPSDVLDPEDPSLGACLEQTARVAVQGMHCERVEPISDPVAPPPPPTARMGVDFGAGLQSSSAPIEPVLIAWGAAYDWHFAPPLTGGFRLRYLAGAGDTTDEDGDGLRESNTENLHLLEPDLRFRLRFGDRKLRAELEAMGGVRLSLTNVVDHHVVAGLGAVLYVKKFGVGAHYARGFGDDALTDSVLLTVERSTPLDADDSWRRDGDSDDAPRVGLGMHAIATGWGFAEGLGILLPGVAIELPVYVGWPVVPVARWDVLWFVGIDGPALTMQSALAGLQYYRIDPLRLGLSALAGYSIAYGDAPRVADAGPVGDAGVWFWLDDLGTHLGINGRSGLIKENRDLKVVYLSLGGRQIF